MPLISTAAICAVLLSDCEAPMSGGASTIGNFITSPSGNARRGVRLFDQVGCGVCHTVPGTRRARTRAGPSLNLFARRAFISGEIPNTPRMLVRWIMDPPGLISSTAMPRLNMNERDARDIAAYLYTLD